MRLKRFTASGLHGFLKFDIKFNDDLTFLTGINGSGKTTALYAIVALITPDLTLLSSLEYTKIAVSIDHESRSYTITAESDETSVALSVSNSSDRLIFSRYVIDPDLPPGRQSEAEAEHFRDLLANRVDHPVVRFISSLPTPMFLGLDRRARFDEDIRRSRYVARPRTGRNIFGSSLSRSLADASELAETRYRDALIASGQLAEKLQRELLLNLISASPEERADFGSLTLPTQADRREIGRVRRDLETLAHILHLATSEVRKRVSPYLDQLERITSNIPTDTNIGQLLRDDSSNSPVLNAILQWTTQQPHLKRIKVISDTVARYTKERFELLQPTTNYLKLVNQFIGDREKQIQFGARGNLYVSIEGVAEEKSINYLSSGEAQIFVILTHLAFHPLARKDNVFIIDEPELSLHIQWQEIFVDSITSANSNIQYVLATHSPSIIMERIDKCVDVSRKKRR